MEQGEQNPDTETQRLALENMSAELVRKLHLMIQEQEERVRNFAEEHKAAIPERAPEEPVKAIWPAAPPAPSPAQPLTRSAPPPSPKQAPHFKSQPKKQAQEESNIGMGIIIFSLIGIFMLIRSCT